MYSLDFEFNLAKKQFAKIKYFHNEEKNTRSAFLIDEKGGIGVYIPRRFGTVSASLILFGKWGEEELFRADMSWQDTEKENDLYYAKLD